MPCCNHHLWGGKKVENKESVRFVFVVGLITTLPSGSETKSRGSLLLCSSMLVCPAGQVQFLLVCFDSGQGTTPGAGLTDGVDSLEGDGALLELFVLEFNRRERGFNPGSKEDNNRRLEVFPIPDGDGVGKAVP